MLKKTKTITNTSNEEVGFLETSFLQNRHTDMLYSFIFICFTYTLTFTEILKRIFAFKCKVNFKLRFLLLSPSNFTGFFLFLHLFLSRFKHTGAQCVIYIFSQYLYTYA